MQKSYDIGCLLLEIMIIKEFCNLIIEFSQIRSLWRKIIQIVQFFILGYLMQKVLTRVSENSIKLHFRPFLPIFGQTRIFLEIRFRHFSVSKFLSLRKTSENNN